MTAGSGGAAPPGARHPKRGEGFQVAVLKRRPLTQLPYKNLPLLPRHVRGDPRGRQHQLGRDTLRLHGVHKLPEPQFTNRGAGENAALACKISCIAQRRAIPSTLHSRRAASNPSFPPQSLPGVRSSPKAGLQLPCCGPLCPGRRRPCPEEGSPHSPSPLAGCCAGMAGHSPRPSPFSEEPATPGAVPSAAAGRSPLHKSRPEKNARFAFAGKHRHLAILRAPRPAPAPSGARFGAENAPGRSLAFTGTGVSGQLGSAAEVSV